MNLFKKLMSKLLKWEYALIYTAIGTVYIGRVKKFPNGVRYHQQGSDKIVLLDDGSFSKKPCFIFDPMKWENINDNQKT